MRVVDDEERRHRLAVRHALAVPVDTVERAAEAVVCLHATEPANAYLSVAVRSHAQRADMDRALYAERSIVRQLAMRRTVFGFPRALLPAVRGSAAARVRTQQVALLARQLEAAGITDDGRAWVARAEAAVRRELAERPATTATLRDAVPQLAHRLPPQGSTGGSTPVASRLLTAMAADGSVVRGDNDGGWRTSRPLWTLAEHWLGEPVHSLSDHEGYAELVRRWLWAFGPGTEADIVWWLGATKAAVRRALADVGAVEVRLSDGSPAWLHPGDVEPVPAVEPWAALLPPLDPTVMGWKTRDFYLGPHAGRIFDRNGNGGPTAWWDGRVVGSWTQDESGVVVVVPVEELPSAARAALANEATQLTAWFGGEVVRSVFPSPAVLEHRARVGGR